MTRPASYLALVLSLAVGGCETPSGSDDAGSTAEVDSGTAPEVDSGRPDAGATAIAFTSPDASLEFARGTVRLQLVTTGPDPDRVELWKDGALLVVLPLPYTYDWLSDADDEGEHVFEARALRDGATIASAERRFTIDRTGPTLVEVRPSDGVGARLSDGIEIELSEPLDPASVTTTSVTVHSGDAELAAERTISADGKTIQIVPSGVVLPADVGVLVWTAVTDRAGNALVEAVVHVVHYDAWVRLSAGTLSDDRFISDIAVAGSDVFVLHTDGWYQDARVSRWDGTTLTTLPVFPSVPTRAGARIAVTSTGALVAAWGVDSPWDVHVADLVDGSWVERPVLAGVDTARFFFALELGPGDEPYIARAVGSGRIQTMRLSGSTWLGVGTEIDPGATALEAFDFALDGTRPIFGIDDGPRCRLVTESLSFLAIDSGWSDCQSVAVVDLPGPGAQAFLWVSRRTGSVTYVNETEHWRGPDGWSFQETVLGSYVVVEETPTGWIAARFTELVSSEGERWPLDTEQVWAIDMLHGAPIVATFHQLYVPNGPPITP